MTMERNDRNSVVSLIISTLPWKDKKMVFLFHILQLWNTVSEASLGVYRGHSGWVHCVALSQDACKLVSSSDDETVKVLAQTLNNSCTFKLDQMHSQTQYAMAEQRRSGQTDKQTDRLNKNEKNDLL